MIITSWQHNIMWNARVDEAQAGIKIAKRNTISLRYEMILPLWQKVKRKVKKESEKAGLKLNIQKMKIMASSPITSWQINGETL